VKRYRSIRFFIDCIRNMPNLEELKDFVKQRYGEQDLDNKFNRYSSFKPPGLRIIVEYHTLLQEIEDAYVHGLYYPAVTSACCLGERIFNIIILNLREYYKHSDHFKRLYKKESFGDWEKSIKILSDWKVIDSKEIKNKYLELAEVRHNVIHFNKLEDIESKAKRTLEIIYDITAYLFGVGHRSDIYLWGQGEIYIKKNSEETPFVKKMILPHCHPVGYKHFVDTGNEGQWIIRDNNLYEEREITDEEFIKMRNERRNENFEISGTRT